MDPKRMATIPVIFLSDSSIYLWETNLAIAVSADGLAPNGAKPSADGVITFP